MITKTYKKGDTICFRLDDKREGRGKIEYIYPDGDYWVRITAEDCREFTVGARIIVGKEELV